MRRFLDLRQINVTNVFPTEEAPPGLNYYVATARNPYRFTNEWNWFLSNVHYVTNGIMAGPRSSQAFDTKWESINTVSMADKDALYRLGYNVICYHYGQCPIIWDNRLQGTDWLLSDLMAAVNVIDDIHRTVRNLIKRKQLELFSDKTNLQMNIMRAAITNTVRADRADQTVFCRTLDDPELYTDCLHDGWVFHIPIQGFMWNSPLLLKVKVIPSKGILEYSLPREYKSEYDMIDKLWGTEWLDLKLEPEDSQCKN
jgi:hypothetical protein